MLGFCHASHERAIRLVHPVLTEFLCPLHLGTEMRPESCRVASDPSLRCPREALTLRP